MGNWFKAEFKDSFFENVFFDPEGDFVGLAGDFTAAEEIWVDGIGAFVAEIIFE